jgi:hypothetical protein
MDERSLTQLCDDSALSVREMVKLVSRRCNRDAAMDHLADAVGSLTVIATRIGGKHHGFSERAVKRSDEEEEAAQERRAESAGASLMDVLDADGPVRPSAAEYELVQELADYPKERAAEILHEFVRTQQLRVLRAMISYIWTGALNPWQMMKRALAITRRYQRERIKGISMTEVATLLHEKSRCAAVSARERDAHDELLVRWGVKAPKAADAGLKSPSTCAKNRRAALGNTNRSKRRITANSYN